MIASTTTNFMMMRRVIPEDALMMLGLVAIGGCLLLVIAAYVLFALVWSYCQIYDFCEALYDKYKSKKKERIQYDS